VGIVVMVDGGVGDNSGGGGIPKLIPEIVV